MIILGKFQPTKLRQREIETGISRFLRQLAITYGACPYQCASKQSKRHIHVYSPLKPAPPVPKEDGWHQDYSYNTHTKMWEPVDRSDRQLQWIVFWSSSEPTEIRRLHSEKPYADIQANDVVLVDNFHEEHRTPINAGPRWVAIVRNLSL